MAQHKDIYDQAVEYFTKHPERIFNEWNRAIAQPHKCLLGAALFGSCDVTRHSLDFGCLSEVRAGRVACTEGLTNLIRADRHLPKQRADVASFSPDNIQVKHLDRFRMWQRKMDKILTREVPPMVDLEDFEDE